MKDDLVGECVKLLIGCIVDVATAEEGSGFGFQEVVLDNRLSAVSAVFLKALDDDEKYGEKSIKEAEVGAGLGWKQADGMIVGSDEGKTQFLDVFDPLNAGSSPSFTHSRWQVKGGVLWQPSLLLMGK